MTTTSPVASPLPSPSASASGPSSAPPSGGASDRRNVPLPDELFAIRTEIKRLTEREAAIKQILISDPDTREGASYLAEVKTVRVSSTDWKELKHFHPNLVDEYTYMREQTRVVLMGVTEDGEIVPTRKLKAD